MNGNAGLSFRHDLLSRPIVPIAAASHTPSVMRSKKRVPRPAAARQGLTSTLPAPPSTARPRAARSSSKQVHTCKCNCTLSDPDLIAAVRRHFAFSLRPPVNESSSHDTHRKEQVAILRERLTELKGNCGFCWAADQEHYHPAQECPVITDIDRRKFRKSYAHDPNTCCRKCGGHEEFCRQGCSSTDLDDLVRDIMFALLMANPPAHMEVLFRTVDKAAALLRRPASGPVPLLPCWDSQSNYM